jgi:hypothetical protein
VLITLWGHLAAVMLLVQYSSSACSGADTVDSTLLLDDLRPSRISTLCGWYVYPCRCVQKQAPGSSPSQLQGPTRRILSAIYHKWQRQIQRWADYRSLFSLMGFIAVFLGVLYAQRGATVGYQVHSTIAAVVVPGNNVLQSTADVYSWLQGLLQVRAVLCFKTKSQVMSACMQLSLQQLSSLGLGMYAYVQPVQLNWLLAFTIPTCLPAA